MATSVCILDYGSGNVGSVYNLLRLIEPETKVSNCPEDIKTASHLVLPGVGAFGASMDKIKQRIPLPVLEKEVRDKGKPFLGICVGMQVLADVGHEFGRHQGLGWVTGEVEKVKCDGLPLPHIGWNDVIKVHDSPLFARYSADPNFYFVHSYCLVPDDQAIVSTNTEYGQEFCSAIRQDNIFGVQFHPEKSQQAGQVLIENFLVFSG